MLSIGGAFGGIFVGLIAPAYSPRISSCRRNGPLRHSGPSLVRQVSSVQAPGATAHRRLPCVPSLYEGVRHGSGTRLMARNFYGSVACGMSLPRLTLFVSVSWLRPTWLAVPFPFAPLGTHGYYGRRSGSGWRSKRRTSPHARGVVGWARHPGGIWKARRLLSVLRDQ